MRIRVAALVVLALVVTACSSTDYEYVRNTDLKAAFKVPTDWEVFDQRGVQGTAPGQGGEVPSTTEWLVGIDASPEPSATHVLAATSLAADYPNGAFQVIKLTELDRDRMSIGAMRNIVFNIDGIQGDFGTDAVRILTYDDTIDDDGIRGLHMVAQIQEDAATGAATAGEQPGLISSSYIQLNQRVYWAPQNDRVYLAVILCSVACYERNAGQISSTIDSWTVKL